MCGRFTLRAPSGVIVAQFGLRELSELVARHNIAPTQDVLAVRLAEGGSTAGGDTSLAPGGTLARQGAWLRWGLVPSWAKDTTGGAQLINARSETAAEKPSFRSAFRRRRCLIVADGFYEWKKAGRQKQPYFIHRRDDQPFAFAGLWEHWQKGETPLESCSILTTEANELMRPLHERMPVILSPEAYALWLDPETPPEVLHSLFVSAPTPELELRPVSDYVNTPRHDDPACLAPARVDADTGPNDTGPNDSAAKGNAAKPSPATERQGFLF